MKPFSFLHSKPIRILFASILSVCGENFGTSVDSIRFQTFYDPGANPLLEPVWFGEIPGYPKRYVAGELGGRLVLFESAPNGFQSRFFGQIPVTKCCINDGLLGLAFHPDFEKNRKYYAYYNPVRGQTVLEERIADPSKLEDAGTSRILLRIVLPGQIVHNGGDIHFGPDGLLYLATGDGGNPDRYNTNAQNLHLPLGKMLRIDVNSRQDTLGYAIPASNPFVGHSDPLVLKEIFAFGIRQPWRWTFDPLDGRIFLADVGGYIQDEINLIHAGKNYGWNIAEGNTCFNRNNEKFPLPQCDTVGMAAPIALFNHPSPTPFVTSITGGRVFRGNPNSPFYGTYFFGDFETRKLHALRPNGNGWEMSEIGVAPDHMSSFGSDSEGNIFLVGYDRGIIYRLDHPDLQPAGIRSQPRKWKFHAVRRKNGAFWLETWVFPGMETVRLHDLRGSLRFTAKKEISATGIELRCPSGIYLAEVISSRGKFAFPILLH